MLTELVNLATGYPASLHPELRPVIDAASAELSALRAKVKAGQSADPDAAARNYRAARMLPPATSAAEESERKQRIAELEQRRAQEQSVKDDAGNAARQLLAVERLLAGEPVLDNFLFPAAVMNAAMKAGFDLFRDSLNDWSPRPAPEPTPPRRRLSALIRHAN